MKTVLAFPSDAALPLPHPERWVIGLDHLCPTLEPAMAVIREKGKPARVIRMEPDFETENLKP